MVVAAHSLGNIVVSSAIRPARLYHDPAEDGPYAWEPDHYFMLNAAVPVEAYDAGQTHAGGVADPMNELMRNPSWSVGGLPYNDRLTASHWHELFQDGSLDGEGEPVDGDGRQLLTWRNHFAGITFATNYYSSGEEVLLNSTGAFPNPIQAAQNGSGSWTLQEFVKAPAGWVLNYGAGYPNNPEEANAHDGDDWAITEEQLLQTPFFSPFTDIAGDGQNPGHQGSTLLAPPGDASASSFSTNPTNYAWILAQNIPARSFAAGANAINAFNSDPLNPRNFDMQLDYQTEGEWPSERLSGVFQDRWIHSDLKDMAYPYVYRFFHDIVKKGDLR